MGTIVTPTEEPARDSAVAGWVKGHLEGLQAYSLLTGRAFRNFFARPFYGGDVILQMDSIGVGSLPIVVLTGFFTGAVMALQLASTLAQYGQIERTGQLVALSLVRELGPVLTGLMVAGRNAAGMASELGSMVVTEQVDAMRALGTDPLKKLVAPRLLATLTMMFFLAVIADLCGMVGGFLYAVLALGLDARQYWYTALQALGSTDISQGLLKPVVFGIIVASVGCYYGMSARGGTRGVGRATTQSVVAASVLIILSDFLISRVLIGIFGS
ncbi:MAG TPA: ABC transporter permease [Terriglobales bacterium]|nr:ABC transporter permease [Terriglobales bacterium]